MKLPTQETFCHLPQLDGNTSLLSENSTIIDESNFDSENKFKIPVLISSNFYDQNSVAPAWYEAYEQRHNIPPVRKTIYRKISF